MSNTVNQAIQGGSISELPVLQITNLHKSYGSHSVLEGVSFCIPRGKIVGLLGPNGCGKSTIMKLIAGLIPLSKGEILIDGMAPGQKTKSLISYLPERSYLNDWMRISDLLSFFHDFYSDFDLERAKQMLADLNIALNDRLKTMSKGTKEKVQLVLVMARRAKLYLLDEPIAGVDPAAREFIMNTILTNYDEKASVLISTHLISDVEPVLDEAIFLREGQVVLHDSADALREREGKSLDALFRDVFRAQIYGGGTL